MWWGEMFASLILAHTLEIQTGHGALAKAGPGQWPQLLLGSTFCLSAALTLLQALQCRFLPSLPRQLSEQRVEEKGSVFTQTQGHKERNKCWVRRRKPKGLRQMCHSELRSESLLLELSLVFQTWDAVCGCHPAFSFIIHQDTQAKTEKWWKKRSLKNTTFTIAFLFQFLFIIYFQTKAQYFLCPTREQGILMNWK